MRNTSKLAVVAVALAVAACGANRTDRVLSGAGIGAGAGLLVDEPLAGAAVGGLAGAVTDADDIDLGEPIWRR